MPYSPRRKTATTLGSGLTSSDNKKGITAIRMGLHEPIDQIDPTTHFAQSFSRQGRVHLDYLRAFADTPPVRAAIARIVDGVAGMKWTIDAPEGSREKESAIKLARDLESTLKRPSAGVEGNDTFTLFTSSVITDLLVMNVSCVERQKGKDPSGQAFWLWSVDPANIKLNLDWKPELSGALPRYYDTRGSGNSGDWRALMDDDLFMVKRFANTWRLNPPGPLEVAYRIVASWLGLTDFQAKTVSRATQDYLIDLGPISDSELSAFRNYFQIEVLQHKRPPIFGTREGGRGISVVKIGASNDSGLYLAYYEWLLKIIALCFQLAAQDVNIQQHDNRATADVAANSTFQFAILPMGIMLFEKLQFEVIDFFYKGYTLKLADLEPRDQEKEVNSAVTLYREKLVTQNEARLDVGKPSLGARGDIFVDGSSRNSDELPASDPRQGQPNLQPVQPGTAPAVTPKNDQKQSVPKSGGKGKVQEQEIQARQLSLLT